MVARKTVDVTHREELRRLAEEVARSGEDRALTVKGREIAVISPLSRSLGPIVRPRKRSKGAYARFLSSACGWKGLIDTEEFKRRIRETREITKPAPNL